MKVINKTSRKTIAGSAKMCSSQMAKARGLMFSKPLKNRALIFVFRKEKRVALHMLFVFFPIDIMFLDEKQRVLELREGVKPFTPFVKSRKRIRWVVELPNGTIKRTKTKIGDLIKCQENHWSQTSGMKRSATLRHKSQWFLSMIGIFLMHLHKVQAISQRLIENSDILRKIYKPNLEGNGYVGLI